MKLLDFKIYTKYIIYVAMSIGWNISSVFGQQINITLIEMMPNMPSPYEMRDWKRVALGYDSLVFDFDRKGQYLPLIWWNPNPVNYPGHPSFGLETVVGSPRFQLAEAINVMPAVIGACLVGIDKSNQNGYNWVLMCEEFFNRRPEENVYLNRFVSNSGGDWWYNTMPNIFFYQLNDLYPNTGDFSYQFTTVADQWLRAVEVLGGSMTPWNVPYMNYRGFLLSTMSPGSTSWPEPESAGAIAWLLYAAYVETGEEKYRIGAEWALEFVDGWPINPSYELQMPYGVYIAARMNAEVGTNYDIEKMVNWCFDLTTYRGNWYNPWGYVDGWGAIVGNWDGYDVSGLIGELSNNEYAFLMNGFEQVGALIPLTRYDDRFARAIGKWVLNVANASRLFYPKYLPPENQDSESWSYQYDPHSYIGHEAIRDSLNGYSPYATGDAISGGWGYTNLTLYGSSHVGILGGIIDSTNVRMILKLDVLKTDFYRDDAYPTYLYFNPYTEDQVVEIDVGEGIYDLYNTVTNEFLTTGVSGKTSVIIPGDQAVQLVITPNGGSITYALDHMLIDDVIVDYRSNQQVDNYAPRIKCLAAEPLTVNLKGSAMVYCTAEDIDNDSILYTWASTHGTFSSDSAIIQWTAPDIPGNYDLKCEVHDVYGRLDSAVITINVSDFNFVDVYTQIPNVNKLFQNYPNPFNPSTTIDFTLPKPEFVTLKVYNIIGEEVATVVNDKLQSGNHTYEFDGSNLASGVYLYRIQAGEFQDVKKMILIK